MPLCRYLKDLSIDRNIWWCTPSQLYMLFTLNLWLYQTRFTWSLSHQNHCRGDQEADILILPQSTIILNNNKTNILVNFGFKLVNCNCQLILLLKVIWGILSDILYISVLSHLVHVFNLNLPIGRNCPPPPMFSYWYFELVSNG